MNRGSILCWRTGVGVGVNSSWHTTESMSQHQIVESRGGGPTLWASGVSESRQEGAAGRTTWIAVVGWADETSARRGSAVYPSFARLGASRPPQHVQVETTCRRVEWPHSPAVWQHQPKREPWRLSPVRRKKVYEKGGSKLSGRKSTRALTRRK